MKSRNLAMVSALLASSCCIMPLTLALVGLGTLGFGSVLGKYHWPIQIAGAALLGVAWAVFLGEKRRLYALAADIKHERLTRSLLSVASVVVALFIGMSLYSEIGVSEPLRASPSGEALAGSASARGVVATLTVPVEGMTCASCELMVERALKKVDGVLSSEASVRRANVVVSYDPTRTDLHELVDAIDATGYRAGLPGGG